jgi:tetratricopeptide (TPR) repeat protein
MGGVGKTALALKLAEQLKDEYPDAQFYVDLKGVTQPLTPKEAMAHVIRAWNPLQQLPEQEEDVAALYRSVLDGKRALLLMDNARDADQVRPLIPPTSGLLLVTSRQRFALPGLVEKDLSKLSETDACALLVKITPRLCREKKGVVENLADLCGYLPLALEKVASALKVKKNISPTDYAYRLADARNRLQLTETDAALQQSYDLLSQKLQEKFCLLAVFPYTFGLAAAGVIWEIKSEEALYPLGELLAYSLVEYDEIAQRYRLHDLVRLFAGQRLTLEKRTMAQKLHAGHYLNVLRDADQLYGKGGDSVAAGLALFDLEWGNIQAGQAWAVLHANNDDNDATTWCCQYPDTGVYCLGLRQHPRERIPWLEAALSAARELEEREWEGNALGNLGFVYDDLGQYRTAIKYYEEGLQIQRELMQHQAEGTSVGNLGVAYLNLGEYARAIEYAQQHLKIAREIDDKNGRMRALCNLGSAHGGLGQYHRAIEYQEQSMQIAQEIGDRVGESHAFGSLGNAYAELGERSRAIEYYEKQLAICREIGYRSGQGSALWNSAIVFDELADRGQAIVRATAALKIFEAIESPSAAKVRAALADWREERKD